MNDEQQLNECLLRSLNICDGFQVEQFLPRRSHSDCHCKMIAAAERWDDRERAHEARIFRARAVAGIDETVRRRTLWERWKGRS